MSVAEGEAACESLRAKITRDIVNETFRRGGVAPPAYWLTPEDAARLLGELNAFLGWYPLVAAKGAMTLSGLTIADVPIKVTEPLLEFNGTGLFAIPQEKQTRKSFPAAALSDKPLSIAALLP